VSGFSARRRSLADTQRVKATQIVVVRSMPISAPADPKVRIPGRPLTDAHTPNSTATPTAIAKEDAMAPTRRMRVVTLIVTCAPGLSNPRATLTRGFLEQICGTALGDGRSRVWIADTTTV